MQFVEQALSTIDLVITANFVELLTAVGDELANFLTLLSSLASSSRVEFATSFSRWWSYGDYTDNAVGYHLGIRFEAV